MSIETELQQALDTIDSMEQHTADAYAALQRNGASLPEKCNLANLAGVVEKVRGLSDVSLAITTTGIVNIGLKGYTPTGSTITAAQDFAAQCGVSKNSISGRFFANYVGSVWAKTTDVSKSWVTEVYLDFENNSGDRAGYLLGGDTRAHSFYRLEKATIKNANTIFSYAFIRAFSESSEAHELILENVKEIQKGFLYQAQFKGALILPDGLSSVGQEFCFACYGLKELYVPDGCAPPTDIYSLSGDSNIDNVLSGVTLRGPGAAVWKAALPDRASSPYRKLILDPEWA